MRPHGKNLKRSSRRREGTRLFAETAPSGIGRIVVKVRCLSQTSGDGVPSQWHLDTDEASRTVNHGIFLGNLLVDEEPHLRDMLTGALFRDGYRVTPAASGLEALTFLREKSFQVLLTDTSMPKISGIELLELVSKIHTDMAVVLITGFGDVQIARSCP